MQALYKEKHCRARAVARAWLIYVERKGEWLFPMLQVNARRIHFL